MLLSRDCIVYGHKCLGHGREMNVEFTAYIREICQEKKRKERKKKIRVERNANDVREEKLQR